MKKDLSLDAPFPLRARYLFRILPGIFVFMLVLVALTAYGSFKMTSQFYLQVAMQRAESVATFVQNTAPQSWAHMLAGHLTRHDQNFDADYGAIDASLREVLPAAGIDMLKIYDLNRRVIYATDASKLGEIENNDSIFHVLEARTPTKNSELLVNGLQLHELYAPVFDDAGQMLTIFELYEPDHKMNQVMRSNTLVPAGISLVLLLLLLIVLTRLVFSAQEDIDYRTQLLVQLRRRLEVFLPKTAVMAAKEVDSSGDIPSQLRQCTILYLDIRSFTVFSENRTPEEVVAFLNRVFEVAINAIQAHQGEVDKFIGDAVLAWFSGEAPQQAINAARQIIATQAEDFPCRVGIGLFTGPVVAGAVGPKTRRDFTIIGNSVNMAARLCSNAAPDEIVADVATITDAGRAAHGFGPAERIKVKGIDAELEVHRLKNR